GHAPNKKAGSSLGHKRPIVRPPRVLGPFVLSTTGFILASFGLERPGLRLECVSSFCQPELSPTNHVRPRDIRFRAPCLLSSPGAQQRGNGCLALKCVVVR